METFEDKMFLDGFKCTDNVAVEGKCEIQATKQVNGELVASSEADKIFIDKWAETNNYDSPYPEV